MVILDTTNERDMKCESRENLDQREIHNHVLDYDGILSKGGVWVK